MARRFAADGDKVILLARTAAKVQALADEIGNGATAVSCVVSDPASVRHAFEQIAVRYGSIDALINNAANFTPARFEEASDQLILDSVLSNLAGPMFCTRAALPLLRRGGHVINVSSETVSVELPMLVVYQSTKAGLERFSSSLAAELADRGIRVTVFRAGQMAGADAAPKIDPELGRQIFAESLKRGFNLMERGMTSYQSAAALMRAVIDTPPDMHLVQVSFHGYQGVGP
jgi:NAD(P)-dependent dehydrogenase (short-subunit alcohol dehydrogenase family)